VFCTWPCIQVPALARNTPTRQAREAKRPLGRRSSMRGQLSASSWNVEGGTMTKAEPANRASTRHAQALTNEQGRSCASTRAGSACPRKRKVA